MSNTVHEHIASQIDCAKKRRIPSFEPRSGTHSGASQYALKNCHEASLKMRILLVCHDSAHSRSYGAGLRTNDIWRALCHLGEVSVLVMEPSHLTAIDDTPRDDELGRISFDRPALPWVTPETLKIRRLVSQTVGSRQFDLVVVRYLRLAMLVSGSVAAPILVDGDDLDKIAPTIGKAFWRRWIETLKSEARRMVTRIAIRNFAYVWYVNPLDMVKFPSKLGSVLPNVSPAPLNAHDRISTGHACILMVGKFGYEPNAEAAAYFIREVLPSLRATLPTLRFRMVGQCPPDLAAKYRAVDGIEIAGFVDDLTAEYARAAAVVAPVFSGGGTQIKVLEALGHQCGTVVSAFSAAGFSPNLIAGEHMLVARNTAEWKSHCLSLINSPAHAEKLGRAGRAAVLKMYSFDGMAKEVKASLGRLRQLPQ
jgi:polysaccharide biosynthesis protein PslH